jgi:diacylglycerol kinase (ATP)
VTESAQRWQQLPAECPVRACIVLNPRAGNAEDISGVRAAVQTWKARGWEVDLATTAYAGHAIELARSAAQQGYEVVVAAGGDGTVNEVVNGIAHTNTALAVLPIGTGNVWGRELRLPLHSHDAAVCLASGNLVTLDLGKANQRYFLLMAGIGFDAAVTRSVRPEAKRKLGLMAYIVQALRLAPDVRGTRAELLIDGRVVRGNVLMVVIGNSRLYGGYLQITHQANLTDGLLDIVVIKGQDVRSAPLHLLSIVLRRYNTNPDMEYFRAREVTINSAKPLGIQVDGDLIGETPMTFCVEPDALRALVPAWATHDLLGLAPGLRLPVLDQIRRVFNAGSSHRR